MKLIKLLLLYCRVSSNNSLTPYCPSNSFQSLLHLMFPGNYHHVCWGFDSWPTDPSGILILDRVSSIFMFKRCFHMANSRHFFICFHSANTPADFGRYYSASIYVETEMGVSSHFSCGSLVAALCKGVSQRYIER